MATLVLALGALGYVAFIADILRAMIWPLG